MIRKKPTRSGPIEVDLTGPQGNAHWLLGAAERWAKQLNEAGLDVDWPAIEKDATSDDYEHLLQVLDQHFGQFVTFLR